MLINRILGRSLIVLLVAGMGFAHSQTLSGKITDSETGEPLPGAQVFVKGTFVAVSYTHLRAHETPEQLLCPIVL